MNTLDFEKLGVQGLDTKEMVEVDGGNIWRKAAEYALLVYDSLEDFVEGVVEGYESTYRPASQR